MKNKQTRKITLKKLTIARIDLNTMKKVKGGDCIPTEHIDSHFECGSTRHLF